MIFQRRDGFLIGALGPGTDAQHPRLARTVDIGIKHAGGGPVSTERKRQVDRGRALAHPALARGNRDNVLDARERLQALLDRVRFDPAGCEHHRSVDPRLRQ